MRNMCHEQEPWMWMRYCQEQCKCNFLPPPLHPVKGKKNIWNSQLHHICCIAVRIVLCQQTKGTAPLHTEIFPLTPGM